jgi:hypothetical protein
MIPFILAAVGGYLIGDSVKSEKFANGGEIINEVEIIDDVDDNLLQNLNEKLRVYKKYKNFNKVTGKYGNDFSTLYFYDDDKLIFSIDSEWDEDIELATLDMDGEKYNFNAHPFDGFGGINTEKLAEDFEKALNEVSTFSATISLEGYNIYTEKAKSKSEANRILQGLKENTRFEVVKGSAEIGKLKR